MSKDTKFLGWEISFKDETNDIEYGSEIIELAIGQDVNSSVVMCSMKFAVDTSFSKYFSKKHEGKLTITNKTVISDDVDEMYIIDLQSVSNNGTLVEREEDGTKLDRINIPIKYMCKNGIKLMNSRVGGVFEKKKLEDIVKELYKKTECEIPLKIEKCNNTQQYDNIMVPEGSFIEAMRYLNQKFGLYDNLFIMYGKTFTDESQEWIINCANKINGEEIKLNLVPYEQSSKKVSKIEEKEYYTYQNLKIRNNLSVLSRKIPKVLKCISFDNDKFVKRKDVSILKTLGELAFSVCSKQFKKLDIPTQLFSSSRLSSIDYAIKDSIHKIGLSSYSMPNIIIHNPFKLKHFQIGTTIQLKSQVTEYIDADVKLLVLGWMLHIKQGTGNGGGASYSSQLSLRTVATSYLETEKPKEDKGVENSKNVTQDQEDKSDWRKTHPNSQFESDEERNAAYSWLNNGPRFRNETERNDAMQWLYGSQSSKSVSK